MRFGGDGCKLLLPRACFRLNLALHRKRRIVKEMQEELRYKITKVQTVVRALCKPSRDHGKILFFTCTYSPADKVSDGGGLKEEGEDIEVLEIPLHEAAAMITAGEIVDAKTVVLIQYLSNRVSADASSWFE